MTLNTSMTRAQAHKQRTGKYVSYPFRLYDDNGNVTYSENSDGFWRKYKYDANGNETYYEDSDGFWEKSEFDANGNMTYYEESTGFWSKRQYDADGNETYYEDSKGRVIGNKQSSRDGKIVEVNGMKYELE